MEALNKGVAVSLQLSADKHTVKVAAVYSPGVISASGKSENWVFWEITRNMSAGGDERIWKAAAYRHLECGLVLPLNVRAFNNHSGVVASSLSDLLVGLGVGISVRTPKMMGFTSSFVEQIDGEELAQSSSEIHQLGWFFSPDMADIAKVAVEAAQ